MLCMIVQLLVPISPRVTYVDVSFFFFFCIREFFYGVYANPCVIAIYRYNTLWPWIYISIYCQFSGHLWCETAW